MGFGLLSALAPRRTSHVHVYRNITSVNVRHLHRMGGVTGPTIGSGPGHVHRMAGTTTFYDGHTHKYATVTGPAIPVFPGVHVHRYQGVTTVNGKVPHTHRFSGITAPAPDDITIVAP
ncbi:hypothetical protein IT084_09635 [Desulfallas sp. Bu1-1]|uniref:YmaF family protein n=1 Tax=Desulfallas sp. Bu1-1 TaxID=2787620 RepID=UPI00189E6982|nr:YmaF family protein [Desulfallas sp. Bu1-1]MBF7083234.1 hypothetical protein [Desulfallas sp. Bu1-1]